MKNKQNQEREGSLDTLDVLLQEMKRQGIDESEFSKVSFELDYSGCYYESDTPSICWLYRP